MRLLSHDRVVALGTDRCHAGDSGCFQPQRYRNSGAIKSRRPARAAVAGADITVHGRVAQTPDELAGAEVHVRVVQSFQDMATRAQSFGHARAQGGLDVHGQTAVPFPAGRVAGRLRLLAVVQHAHQGLQLSLGLHVASHDAEAHHRRAVAHQKARDDGVEGPLAAGHHIGMLGVQAETVAAVLQADAGARHDHARAEAHVMDWMKLTIMPLRSAAVR